MRCRNGFEKVIRQTNIQSEYKSFVDEYIAGLISEFGDKIHSIYMCGSIPKGSAKPFKSDADFTIVCDNPEEIDDNRVTWLKERMLEEYPLVTKIDTVICSKDDVLSMPNEWGFWIKIICVCVYGNDIGEVVPPIHITPEFILDLNNDTKEAVERVRRFLSNASDDILRTRYMKGYSKRLLRAFYSLVLEDTGVWQDDIRLMKNAIIRYIDIDATFIEYLYRCYLDSSVPVEEFLKKTDIIYNIFEGKLSDLAASRTPSNE